MNSLVDLSKDELIGKVTELTALIDTMKNEKNQQELINFPWIGNLGNWYWYVKTNNVTFNDQKIVALGYTREELPQEIGFEFFTEKIHPEDYERVMENMRDHLEGRSSAYETSYRIKKKNSTWAWFYDRGLISKRDNDGKPEMVSGIVFDISEQKRLEELLSTQNRQLEELSRIDFLTNLNNRRVLFERLHFEKRRSDRTGEPLSILMFDLDHFKQVNDKFGHQIGDKVLVRVAQTMQASVRNTDITGRYGGEEFMVILPNCKQMDACKIAEKIRAVVEDLTFENGLKVTISGGVKEYFGEPVDIMVYLVDLVLYAAKKNGRNRIEVEQK